MNVYSNPLMDAFRERFPDYTSCRVMLSTALDECKQYADAMGIEVVDALARNASAFRNLTDAEAMKYVKRATEQAGPGGTIYR